MRVEFGQSPMEAIMHSQHIGSALITEPLLIGLVLLTGLALAALLALFVADMLAQIRRMEEGLTPAYTRETWLRKQAMLLARERQRNRR
jgi:hypothetical protein